MSPHLRKATCFLLALAAICLLLPACKRSPAANSRIQVTYWEKWTGAEADALQKVVDRFNASQDRIQVNLVAMAQIDRKLIAATAGGVPPDLAGIWVPQIPSYADRNALLPLDDFIREDARRAGEQDIEGAPARFLSRMIPVYADMCRHRDGIYAVITTPSAVALHWNKAHFREAGLDPDRPPRTRAELDEYARRLSIRDPATGNLQRAGFLPHEPGWWSWSNAYWFRGGYLDAEGRLTVSGSNGNLEAMRWLRSYTDEFGLANLQRFTSGFGTFGSPQSAFFSGKVSMVLQGVWLNNYIGQFAPGMDYGVAAWPAIDEAAAEGPPFATTEADMLVIPRGARHPEAAWEFIRYLYASNPSARTPEEISGVEQLCFLQEKNSPLRDWSPAFVEFHPHPHILLFRELSNSPLAVFVPKTGVVQELLRELSTAMEKVRLLESTPEEALDYVQKRMEPSLARHEESVRRHSEESSQ